MVLGECPLPFLPPAGLRVGDRHAKMQQLAALGVFFWVVDMQWGCHMHPHQGPALFPLSMVTLIESNPRALLQTDPRRVPAMPGLCKRQSKSSWPEPTGLTSQTSLCMRTVQINLFPLWRRDGSNPLKNNSIERPAVAFNVNVCLICLKYIIYQISIKQYRCVCVYKYVCIYSHTSL